jgi:hypothetical protein
MIFPSKPINTDNTEVGLGTLADPKKGPGLPDNTERYQDNGRPEGTAARIWRNSIGLTATAAKKAKQGGLNI